MMQILLFVAMIGLIIWAFATNILWGLLLLVAVLLYFCFKQYAGFCVAMALRRYGEQDIDGCFKWFSRAEKRGMDVNHKVTYAYCLMREGQVERSEEILNAVLAFPQKDELKKLAKSNHAILLLKTGRVQEAKEEMEELFPTYRTSGLYGSLGYVYIIGNDMEKAEAFNLEAYDYNKDNPVILDNMVQLYIKQGDYEKAYVYVQELLEKNPVFIEAYYNAAVVEKALGKIEDAKQHLEHALTIRTTFISTVSHEEVQRLLETL